MSDEKSTEQDSCEHDWKQVQYDREYGWYLDVCAICNKVQAGFRVDSPSLNPSPLHGEGLERKRTRIARPYDKRTQR